jgi:hypothetical protein
MKIPPSRCRAAVVRLALLVASPTSSSSCATTCAPTRSAATAPKHVKTPHIDRLAHEGVKFANTFCTTSLCSPSRASSSAASMRTARRDRDNFTEYPAALPQLPGRLLQAAATPPPTSANGTWARITTIHAPASTGSSRTRARANTSTPSGTSTARERESHQGLLHHRRHRLALDWLKSRAKTPTNPGALFHRPQGPAQLLHARAEKV